MMSLNGEQSTAEATTTTSSLTDNNTCDIGFFRNSPVKRGVANNIDGLIAQVTGMEFI